MTTTTSTLPSATSSSTSTCVTMTPDKDGYVPPGACNAYFDYRPSFPAAVLFAVSFGLLTISHIVQRFIYKKAFTWVVIMGALWETGSFIARSYATKHQQNIASNTASTLLLLLAPLWINAFIYMVLGRLVYFFHPAQKVFGIHASRYSMIFVWLDIVAFLVQACGGIMLTGTNVPESQIQLGMHVYMGGIGVQQAFILLFTAMMIKFHLEMNALDRRMGTTIGGKTGWKKMVYALYVVLALITIRICYRIAEYSRGVSASNYMITSEAWMYCFDALPMSLALLILAIVHPGSVLQGEGSEFPKLSRKEKKQLKREKKMAKKAATAGHGGVYENIDHVEMQSSTRDLA